MEISEEIGQRLNDLKAELENLINAAGPEGEKEALKDLRDGFLHGAQTVQTQLDRYNERRWR